MKIPDPFITRHPSRMIPAEALKDRDIIMAYHPPGRWDTWHDWQGQEYIYPAKDYPNGPIPDYVDAGAYFMIKILSNEDGEICP